MLQERASGTGTHREEEPRRDKKREKERARVGATHGRGEGGLYVGTHREEAAPERYNERRQKDGKYKR